MSSAAEKKPLFTRTERTVAWAIGLLLAFAVVTLILYKVIFVQILPGQAGVRYSLLFGGTQVDETVPEGFAVKLPWDRIYIYEVRVRQMPFAFDALSAEGMTVRIEGNILYRPIYDKLGLLQKNVGPEYAERIVAPVALAAVRESVAKYNSQELYSVSYTKLKEEILALIANHPASSVVDFADIAIRIVALPPAVSKAIELKLSQEQLAASYEFKLIAEKQEAERKRIQAIGIQNFYAIVSESLTDTVLTWRGIEATVELSQSPNTKVVVVGGDRDQMPLILGSDVTRAPDVAQSVPALDPSTAPSLPENLEQPVLFPELEDAVTSRGVTRSGTLAAVPSKQPPEAGTVDPGPGIPGGTPAEDPSNTGPAPGTGSGPAPSAPAARPAPTPEAAQ
ncbi:MAG: prohibitin family protein [Pseudomonadota bacterium]